MHAEKTTNTINVEQLMRGRPLVGRGVCGALACLLMGCGVADGSSSSEAKGNEGSATGIQGQELARIDFSSTHSVVFVKSERGGVVVIETGEESDVDEQIDFEALSTLSPSQKFATLAASHNVDATPPAALLEAERMQPAPDEALAAPPQGPGAQREVRHPRTVVDQNSGLGAIRQGIDWAADADWWTSNYCKSSRTDAVWCPTNITWAHSGWEPTMYFQTNCLAASTTASARHWTEYWDGSSWVRDWEVTIAARHWWRFTDETTITRRAGCDGSSPDPHVDYSLRTRWATPTFKTASDFPSDRSFEEGNGLQGVTHNSKYWFFTRAAVKTLDGNPESRIWRVPLGSDLRYSSSWTGKGNPWTGTYNHYGDPVYVDGKIYVPLEPSGGSGTGAAFAVFNSDLQTYGYGKIPSESPQLSGSGGPASWLAYNPKDKLFYSSRYHTTKLHRYQIAVTSSGVQVTYKDSIDIKDGSGNTVSAFGYIQGGKFSASGKLYLARWLSEGGIYVIDPNNGRYQTKVGVKYDKSSYEELEGLDIFDTTGLGIPGISSQVHVLLVQSEGLSNDDLWFKHFNVADFDKL